MGAPERAYLVGQAKRLGTIMRWKITVANSAIVLLASVVSFVLLRQNLTGLLASEVSRKVQAERAVSAVTNQIELDSLRVERWLDEQTQTEQVRSVFEIGSPQARGANATQQASRLREAYARDESVTGTELSLLVFVDDRGVAIGRNNSSQMRGENLGVNYPSLMTALLEGRASSHFWSNAKRSEQLSVSYAPVRAESGRVLGALVAGSPMGDERLSRLSVQTSGLELTLCTSDSEGVIGVIATGRPNSRAQSFPAVSLGVLRLASESLKGRRVEMAVAGRIVAAQRLRGLGEARAFVVARSSSAQVKVVTSLFWPLAAAAALGLVLVFSAGTILANYMSQPIAELEEGLLSVINGRTNHRFALQHQELGGLVSHLNSLLNSVMGIPEIDDTGRTSYPAGAAYKDSDEP